LLLYGVIQNKWYENDEEHATNICLMAKEMQGDKKSEYESSDEVDISTLYECF